MPTRYETFLDSLKRLGDLDWGWGESKCQDCGGQAELLHLGKYFCFPCWNKAGCP